jgi:hypothetical protein
MFLDHALKTFGPERVLAESNWFVNTAMGDPYDGSFCQVKAACERAGENGFLPLTKGHL